MECPKCHKEIAENATICPYCHKVLALVCPNCKTLNKNQICSKCGYLILTKCAKCKRTVSTTAEKCKCGYNIVSSIAANECESDEFAAVTVKFSGLKAIKGILASQELYSKFIIKLKNLLFSQIKNKEWFVINYNDCYVINFNKELSFTTSANKAAKLALKLVNVFSGLNAKVIEEFGIPLKLSISIIKKKSEELLINKNIENNVRLLTVKKETRRYLKGMQIILDQYVQDSISKEYKTDSLFSVEQDGNTIMYYEILLDEYILPPAESIEQPINVKNTELQKIEQSSTPNDMYSFKVFDIKAKCKFERCFANELFSKLISDKKIISIRSTKELGVRTSDLINYYESKGFKVLYAVCTEELTYKPWGLFELLYKEFYKISTAVGFMPDSNDSKQFEIINNMIKGYGVNAVSSEDARFAYMEEFGKFLGMLKEYAVVIDGFENIDDTSLQTLELYFDDYKKIVPSFIFITDVETAVHSKIKSLMKTNMYVEYSLCKANIDSLLSAVKEDATDFVQSFYYEKIKENFAGSKLYFENAIQYLIEKDVLAEFENRLLIRSNSSVMLPKDIYSLYRTRLKNLSKFQDASLILAYSSILGYRLDFKLLETLEIKDVQKNAKILENAELGFIKDNVFYVNNYLLLRPALRKSLKPEIEDYLAKNIIAKAGKLIDNTTLLLLMGITSKFKEEYLLLWKNSQFAIAVGDYDAYLKNCLGFLSIIDKIEDTIPIEAIEENKKEVFKNILMSLYSYSPEKIYSIENILLIDAMQAQDDENIVKLSNLMLQGALISSNYTEALSLLHNILVRMPDPSLIVNGAINTKFLLLSLVNIEILFNIGDFKQCIEVAKDLLSVVRLEIIEKIKPQNFSTSSFIEHMLDTYRLVAFAKLLSCENDLNEFFNDVKNSLNEDIPEKDCILDLQEFLNGKSFAPSNIENKSPFSKVIYLILQEFAVLNNDYKSFAQNIYQAKLLASDIHQAQLEYICDIFIAYAYLKIGISQKAQSILSDVLEKSEYSAIFNIELLAKYFIAKLRIQNGDYKEAMLIINDSLALIQKRDNYAKVFYALFERLFIDLIKNENISYINVDMEIMNLVHNIPNNQLDRIINRTELNLKNGNNISQQINNNDKNYEDMPTEVLKTDEDFATNTSNNYIQDNQNDLSDLANDIMNSNNSDE